MELYQDKFIVIECLSENIELYQMKTFYYQQIPGIREFRYSMSQNKSYLYYENKSVVTLSKYLQKNPCISDIYRILEQINLTINSCHNYLLYPENFYLDPNWIKLNLSKDEIKVELFYIPFKKNNNENYKVQVMQLISCISKVFNELNDMEGFYYFVRLLDEFRDESYEINLIEHLNYFLTTKSSEKHKNHLFN